MKNDFRQKQIQTAQRLGIAPGQIPRHIAIIMDGNGRWAQRRGIPRLKGHQQGAKIVEKIALDCVDLGIEILTIYSFSTENWKRPAAEVNGLMHLYSRYLVGIRDTLEKHNVKLIHLGRAEPLPENVKKTLAKTQQLTKNNTGMILAMALNYGSRTEIIDAVRKIAQQYKKGQLKLEDINEECIGKNLYTAGLAEPDILIRTAGETRVSNFLLWQISYCEFYVTKTTWPDFERKDLEKAILAYSERARRFGEAKTNEK